jgi:hypothetical protein
MGQEDSYRLGVDAMRVYLVYAMAYGKQPSDVGLFIQAYSDPEIAKQHKDHIDNIDNDFFSYILWVDVKSALDMDNVGLKRMEFDDKEQT